MINNDVLRSIRYMLDLSDNRVVEIARLADPAFAIDKDDVHAVLLKEDEPGYAVCSDDVLAHVLDGLIVHRRGRDESLPLRPVEKRISNNVVLKKLRVAFDDERRIGQTRDLDHFGLAQVEHVTDAAQDVVVDHRSNMRSQNVASLAQTAHSPAAHGARCDAHADAA